MSVLMKARGLSFVSLPYDLLAQHNMSLCKLYISVKDLLAMRNVIEPKRKEETLGRSLGKIK